jgi:hypothetical protein
MTWLELTADTRRLTLTAVKCFRIELRETFSSATCGAKNRNRFAMGLI